MNTKPTRPAPFLACRNLALGAAVLTLGFALQPRLSAQPVHFDVEIASGAPADFDPIVDVVTPTGLGSGRQTIVRVVTDNTGSTTFRLIPDPAGVSTGFAEFAVGSAGSLLADDGVTNVVDAVFAETVPGAATGFQMLRITILYSDAFDFPTAETWSVQVRKEGSAFDYFGFVGSNDPEATAPFMEARVDPPYDARVEVQFEVRDTEAPEFPIVLENRGSAPFDVDSAAISPNDNDFTIIINAVPNIPPGGVSHTADKSSGLWLRLSPSQMGDINATLTVTPSGGGDPGALSLQARGVNLYSHLLIDCSGSMGNALLDGTRLDYARDAAHNLNNWINDFSSGKAYIGLTTFPDCDQPADSDVRVTMNTAQSNSGTIGVELNGLVDRNSTPMQTGVEAARDNMNNRIAPLGLQSQNSLLKKAMLLLSDGHETGSSDALSAAGSLGGIRLFTVPYSPGADVQLMGDMAGATEGEMLTDPSDSTDPIKVKNAFKQAATDWLGLESVADPTGVIQAGHTRSHDACIDDKAYGATFSVGWNRLVQGGVGFTLTSPTGQTITPSTPGVTFHSGQSFATYVIQGDRIRAGAGAGEWTLNLTGGSNLPSGNTEYSWDVLVKSPIRAKPLRRWGILTGDRYLLEVQAVGWLPTQLDGAAVTATYNAPSASFSTYLATAEVDRAWFFSREQLGELDEPSRGWLEALLDDWFGQTAYAQVQETPSVPTAIDGEPASFAQRKLWALENIADNPFTAERATGELQLYDDGTHGDRVAGDGVFSALADKLQFEGRYNHHFELLTPNLPRRNCVQRDFVITDWVDAKLTPALIAQNVAWRPIDQALFFDPTIAREMTTGIPEGAVRSVAVFTPRDESGNYWGIGRASQVRFEIAGATPMGNVIDNGDGSYMQVVQHASGDRPTAAVQAGDVVGPAVEAPRKGLPPWLILVLALVLLAFLLIRKKRGS